MSQKQEFNKEYLEAQIKTCQAVIDQNKGVIDFCTWMLGNINFEVKGESATQE